MEKLSRVLFAAIAACCFATAAGTAAAEPASQEQTQALCLSLQTIASEAVDEARARPDHDILRTTLYQELIADDSTPEINELFRSALVLAWDIHKLGVNSRQAGEFIRNTCMQAPAV